MARRDFDYDETISPPTTATIQFTRDGEKGSRSATFSPVSATKTSYSTLKYRDRETGEERTSEVVTERISVTISILAQANGTLCKSYLDNGSEPNLYAESWVKTVTSTSYVAGPDGPRAQREVVDEFVSQFQLVGSLGIQEYVINGSSVVLSNALVHSSRVITDYFVNEEEGITITKTTRYLCWGLTQEGSQLAAAVASQAESAGEVYSLIDEMTGFVCDGTRVQTVIGREYGVQLRPSEQEELRRELLGPSVEVEDFAVSDFSIGVKPDGFADLSDDQIDFADFDWKPIADDNFDFGPPTADPPIIADPGDTWLSIDDNPYIFDGNDWVIVTPSPPLDPQVDDKWIDSETRDTLAWDGSDWVPYDPAPTDWDPNGPPPYTPDPPVDPEVGDQWIDSDTGEPFVWDGDSWVPYEPSPGSYTAESAGAIYRNKNTGTLYVWRGSTWIPYYDADPLSPDPGSIYVNSVTGIERYWTGASWASTGTTWPTYSLLPPTSPTTGQLWIDSNVHKLRRWDGTGWRPFSPAKPPNPAPGDQWAEASSGINYVWTGSAWVAYSEIPPPSPTVGMVYINPVTGLQYSWLGTVWAETGNVFGSNIDSNIQPTSADSVRGVVIDLPFGNDDTWALALGPNGEYQRWLVPGGARDQAMSLAQLENALRYGSAFGSNVVVQAWELPTEPLEPFYVRAGGIEVMYLADGASWEWDADQLVVACDGILCGATGRVPTERVVPWVPTMVDPRGLPAVGAPTVTSGPVPANTIATPAGFNAARPRGIWALLPTNGTDVFEEYGEAAHIFRPFTPIEADRATVLITISEEETPYTLLPFDQGNEEVVVAITIDDLDHEDLVILLAIDDLDTGGGGGGGGTWSPAALNPTAWFDAGTPGDFTLTGSLVDQWNDKSGNNLHVSSTEIQPPAYGTATQNSLSLVTFDGYNDELRGSSLSNYISASAGTLMIVFRARSIDEGNSEFTYGNQFVVSDLTGYYGICVKAPSGTGSEEVLFFNWDGTDDAISKSIGANNAWVIAVVTHGSGTLTAYFNGGTPSTVASGDTEVLTGPVVFGANPLFNKWLDLDIAMVLFNNVEAGEADVRKLEGYAADRWGIQDVLPSDHPYKADPP